MPKLRFIGTEPYSIPRFAELGKGSVEPGETFDVTDDLADSLAANPLFERAGGPASSEVLSDAAPAIPSAEQPVGVTTSFHGN